MAAQSIENLLGSEIGRGGYGTVYIKKDEPDKCVKVSNKFGNASRAWSNEFKKITTFVEKISGSEHFKSLEMVRLVQPLEFHETPVECYMIMPRVYRPEGREDTKPTVQSQLGCASERVIHKGRGEFIGLAEIKEVVPHKDLDVACYELGVLMGLIHFDGQNDAYDVELFLGMDADSGKCKFYLADFDLSESIVTYDKATLGRMTWALDAVPYFPRASVDEHQFHLFKQGYLSVAPSAELVEKVLKDYDTV